MSRKGTILVVEDEELVRDMVAEELRDAGFHVLEAADGEAASSLLADDCSVDVLFTDIRLPGPLDGWAVAQLARQLRDACRRGNAAFFMKQMGGPVNDKGGELSSIPEDLRIREYPASVTTRPTV